MSKRAQWGFEEKKDAENFVSIHGGSLATFGESIRAAYEDMYQDTKMIQERRKAMEKWMTGHK